MVRNILMPVIVYYLRILLIIDIINYEKYHSFAETFRTGQGGKTCFSDVGSAL